MRVGVAALVLLAGAVAPRAADAVPSARGARAATREEGLEAAIAGNDIVCLARVLRVAAPAPGDTTGHLAHLATLEPVDWVKGALDFDDSLIVYLPNDGDSTARALQSIAQSRGDGALLFFSDAGGYWLVDRTFRSPCGDHVGVLRARAGTWKSELARWRQRADRVSLAGLARRADLIVVAECAPAEPGGAPARFAVAQVTDCLKGARPKEGIRVSQVCGPLAGRQLLFLRRLGGRDFEPLPFALPTRARRSAPSPQALVAEIEQVRESLREMEEKE